MISSDWLALSLVLLLCFLCCLPLLAATLSRHEPFQQWLLRFLMSLERIILAIVDRIAPQEPDKS